MCEGKCVLFENYTFLCTVNSHQTVHFESRWIALNRVPSRFCEFWKFERYRHFWAFLFIPEFFQALFSYSHAEKWPWNAHSEENKHKCAFRNARDAQCVWPVWARCVHTVILSEFNSKLHLCLFSLDYAFHAHVFSWDYENRPEKNPKINRNVWKCLYRSGL